MVPGTHSSGRPGRRAEGQWVDRKIQRKSRVLPCFTMKYRGGLWLPAQSYYTLNQFLENDCVILGLGGRPSSLLLALEGAAGPQNPGETNPRSPACFQPAVQISWAEFEPGVMFKTGNFTENGRCDATTIPESAKDWTNSDEELTLCDLCAQMFWNKEYVRQSGGTVSCANASRQCPSRPQGEQHTAIRKNSAVPIEALLINMNPILAPDLGRLYSRHQWWATGLLPESYVEDEKGAKLVTWTPSFSYRIILRLQLHIEGRQSQSLQSGDYPRPMDPSDANLDSIEVAKQFAKDIGTNKTQLELASFVQNLAPCTGDLILFLVVSNCHAWGC